MIQEFGIDSDVLVIEEHSGNLMRKSISQKDQQIILLHLVLFAPDSQNNEYESDSQGMFNHCWLDAVQENEENGSDVTLYDLDQDLDEISCDNGFESPEEEHYRNFPFFSYMKFIYLGDKRNWNIYDIYFSNN